MHIIFRRPALRRRASTAILFALCTLTACSKPTPPPPPLARVAWFAAEASYADNGSYTGVVHARTESNLGFRVAGKIVERLVDPGDTVHKGQPLMRLDPTDYVLASSAAHAAVDAALARQVQAVSDEARLRKLTTSHAVSTQAYEQAKAAAETANAQVEAERALAQQSDHQREYALLLADADGVVMEVPAEPGQVVAAGQTVLKLARKGQREALVYLPESALASANRHATATLYGQPGSTFAATLRELASVADPQTRTYLARYTLGGAASSAPLGATVTISFQDSIKAQISIPVSAIVDQGRGPGVWVIDAKTSTISLRAVKIAHIGEEQARLSQGLEVGERAVAFGGHLLKDGQKVQLLAPAVKGHGS